VVGQPALEALEGATHGPCLCTGHVLVIDTLYDGTAACGLQESQADLCIHNMLPEFF
jgi:hypothetical protein